MLWGTRNSARAGMVICVCALAALITLGSGACRRSASGPPSWANQDFPTEGMTCTGCEHAIQTEVGKLEGVKEVHASHVQKITHVTYDTNRVKPEQIVAAINKLGYRAKPPSR